MNVGEEHTETLVKAGAYAAAREHGMSRDEAIAFASGMTKASAAKIVRWDDGEEEQDTWWSRNKHWALPTAVGAGAFLLGADAGRNGRKDRSSVTNALGLLGQRVKALLGVPTDPLYKSLTQAPEVTKEE